MSAPIVIVGSGMAGYAVAREFRKLNTETPLLMLTLDDGCAYSKPMLSTGFTKNKTADALVMANAVQMSEQLDMSVRTQTRVQAIDTQKQRITADNEEIAYSKLVLATGAQVNTLPFVNATNNRVCSINDMNDYRKFRSMCGDKQHVAIIGAGLIGCEYANDLHNGGHTVDLISATPLALDNMLPNEAAQCVTTALSEAGINMHLGTGVNALEESTDTVTLTLDNGKTITADLVISAIGLKPNTLLAEEAGIAVNKGILCNRYLETSAANVFTLGDCAEVDGHVLLYVLPMMASARALAKTLAGEATQVSYRVMPVGVKTPICPVVVLPPNEAGEWTTESDGFSSKSLCKDAAGNILGYALTGDASKEKQALSKQVSGIHA